MAIVVLIAERTIGEDKVRLTLRIHEEIAAIICIHGITIDIKDICIHDIKTGTADICIPGFTIDIRGICTPCITTGITGTETIGKRFCY